MYVEKYHSYTYDASALVLVSCTIQLEIHLAVRYDILEGTNQTRRDQTYVECFSVCPSSTQMHVFRDKDSTQLVFVHGFQVKATLETLF